MDKTPRSSDCQWHAIATSTSKLTRSWQRAQSQVGCELDRTPHRTRTGVANTQHNGVRAGESFVRESAPTHLEHVPQNCEAGWTRRLDAEAVVAVFLGVLDEVLLTTNAQRAGLVKCNIH